MHYSCRNHGRCWKKMSDHEFPSKFMSFEFTFFQLISFGYWLSSITASAHLVALVVDRAIYMIFPDWHSRVKWSKVNMLISAGMVLFHVTILTPMLALYSIQDDGSCAMTSRFEIFLKVGSKYSTKLELFN